MRRPVALLVLFALLALRPDELAAKRRRKTPASQPAASQPTAALEAEALKLAEVASQIRGLKVKRRITMGVVSRAQVLARLRQRIAEEYKDDEIAVDEAVLKRLGLLPKDVSYKQAVLDLLTDQVAGFYDPRDRQLHIADWLPAAMQTPALVHEICHALQDQHFDLRPFVKPLKQQSDQQLARSALVEGDCMGVMIEHMLAPSGRDLGSIGGMIDQIAKATQTMGTGAFKKAPRYLRETLTFPYVYGLRFLQKLRSLQPWSAVNQLFRRPPTSTEQMMHFDKYYTPDRPVRLTVRPLPALRDYREVKQDTLGEFQLRVYLEQAVEESIATRAAAGWETDRLVAFVPRQKPDNGAALSPPLVVHFASWESDADALEFVNAQRRVLAKRHKTVKESGTAGVWLFVDAEGQEHSVQLFDRYVLTILGAPAETRELLQTQVWKEWRLGGKKLKAPR